MTTAKISNSNPKLDLMLLTTLEQFHEQERNLQSLENYSSLVRN